MSNEAKTFLETLLPYVRIKVDQAKLAIAFQAERAGLCNRLSPEVIERREWYRTQLRSMTLGKYGH